MSSAYDLPPVNPPLAHKTSDPLAAYREFVEAIAESRNIAKLLMEIKEDVDGNGKPGLKAEVRDMRNELRGMCSEMRDIRGMVRWAFVIFGSLILMNLATMVVLIWFIARS